MKTNQNLIRKMGAFEVTQRTSDGKFNATKLLEQWNKANPANIRRIDKFWDTTSLPELMREIVLNEPEFRTPKLGVQEIDTENQLVISSVKSKDEEFKQLKKLLTTTSRGRNNNATWMHPVLFIKFAMYLNSSFEYHVLKFVSDKLIDYRHEAGDTYPPLCEAVASISEKKSAQDNIMSVARAVNHIVYGKHTKGIRNKVAESVKLQELNDLQKEICGWINMGFVKNYNHLIETLRKKYSQKYMPNVFNP